MQKKEQNIMVTNQESWNQNQRLFHAEKHTGSRYLLHAVVN